MSDFAGDMHNLRRAFDLFEQKTQLLRLLDVSSQAEGVRIFIGGESQVVPFEDLRSSAHPTRWMAKSSVRWASSGPRACRTTG